MSKLKVIITGVAGKMGRMLVNKIVKDKDLQLIGGVDIKEVGRDIGEVAEVGELGIKVVDKLVCLLEETSPEVILDFTCSEVAYKHILTAVKNHIPIIVGTTGIPLAKLQALKEEIENANIGVIIAPNFSIGAVLSILIAQQVAHYLRDVEIIELHHSQKLDAPSGTSLYTAQKLNEVFKKDIEESKNTKSHIFYGIPIHSVRLPGLVAHQEIIFGGEGQVLTIRHDSLSRESFWPGIKLAMTKIKEIKGLVIGLENLLK